MERIRTERDNNRVSRALQRVGDDAATGHNVIPGIIDAVKSYATVGELTNCLVAVYGRYDEPVRF